VPTQIATHALGTLVEVEGLIVIGVEIAIVIEVVHQGPMNAILTILLARHLHLPACPASAQIHLSTQVTLPSIDPHRVAPLALPQSSKILDDRPRIGLLHLATGTITHQEQ
jgi:hypothetical protein